MKTIDEVQRQPGLFPLLRVLMDRSDAPGQYLLLASASPSLARQAGESLLGRVEVVEVAGFDLQEVAGDAQRWDRAVVDRLWLRGGFPPSYLAATDEDSFAWRHGAIAQHVQNALPQFGLGVAAPAMLRFWTMLAHYHGQLWSAADPARSMAVSEPTIRRYLDILTQTMMVRQLQPWHENIGKRQVKAPSTHQGAELDLLMFRGERRVGVEFKRTDVPKITPSMRIAIDDLKLDSLFIVYPGTHRFRLAGGIEAVPLWALSPANGKN